MTSDQKLSAATERLLRGLEAPSPEVAGGRQPGIADPRWSTEVPESLASDAAASSEYDFFKGRVDPQKFLTLVRADLTVRDRTGLEACLRELNDFALRQMARKPTKSGSIPVQVQALIPESWRVSVTIGFGATMFVTRHGDDRFGLRHAQPRWLRTMPSLTGDAEGFVPADSATDLILQVCSDHPYVNTAVARRLMVGAFPQFLRVRSIEQGFARADTREWLGFDDGVSNLRTWPEDTLSRLGFVHANDSEPSWCTDGSYLVYRKIRENLADWRALTDDQQQQRIGRHKDENTPLSRQVDPSDKTLPLYPDPLDERDGPLDSHVRKVQPRRPEPDFTGCADLDRRFLRRPYPFFDGVDAEGNAIAGLQFLGYMRSLREQFEWVAQQWQTNPDFPQPGTGVDVLYRKEILATIDGGYYFCPPAGGEGSFIGEGMFA